MYEVLDHPIIRNMERTGEPDGQPAHFPICPVCGAEADTYFEVIKAGSCEVVGCDECIQEVDAWRNFDG